MSNGPTLKKFAKRRAAKFGPRPRPLADRFAEKIEAVGDCVVFTGTKNNFGYGLIYDRDTGKKELAHRVALRLETGSYPSGTVMHTCDNPSCVKIDHLREAAQSENMIDKAKKGRNKNQHTSATMEQAERAVALYDQGYSQAEVAELIGLHQTTVSRIVRGAVIGLPVISARVERRRRKSGH